MVFFLPDASNQFGSNAPQFAMGGWRDTGNKIACLVFESSVAGIVAISNLLIIVVMVVGWRKLLKNNFYIIVANLIVCTSLKAFVELTFVIPYYVMQRDGVRRYFGYFSTQYELVIFNLSVFADYGTLFFSLHIAINRYFSVVGQFEERRSSRIGILLSCSAAWLCTAVVPLQYFLLECQFVYDFDVGLYYNKCARSSPLLRCLLDCLIYLSYAVALLVLAIYIYTFYVFHSERGKRHYGSARNASALAASKQFQLLQQSAVIFALYAASILCVFLLTLVNHRNLGVYEIVYAENLLNLFIAAIYPICFLFMSGEMRDVIVAKIAPRPAMRLASISVNIPMTPITKHSMFL